jgi:hypothetical protein
MDELTRKRGSEPSSSSAVDDQSSARPTADAADGVNDAAKSSKPTTAPVPPAMQEPPAGHDTIRTAGRHGESRR